MKSRKSQIHARVHKIPTLRFDDNRLTSFAGLVIFQAFFQRFQLKKKIKRSFSHLIDVGCFGFATIFMQLLVHIIIGYHRIRDAEYYNDDPIVCRAIGVRKLASPATLSRNLAKIDDKGVENVRMLSRQIVLDRLESERLARVTMDYDGSVLLTRGHAEGTAVGYCKQKKGARSYYPLFCTIPQLQQFLDIHHRPGNVHDSNGAKDFIRECYHHIRQSLPQAAYEARMDSAFFSQDIINEMDQLGIEFTVSVPFERFPELKMKIEQRKRWKRLDNIWSYFEIPWHPKSWETPFRFIFIRQTVAVQHKEPIQLDLFVPQDHGYEYKVIITNKTCGAKKVLKFHNGRGTQEGLFGEAKTDSFLGYIPTRRQVGNRLFIHAAVMAHNITKEIQMEAKSPLRGTTEKRSPLWSFQTLGTLRHRIINRAGRLTKPEGKLTLTMSANQRVQQELKTLLEAA